MKEIGKKGSGTNDNRERRNVENKEIKGGDEGTEKMERKDIER